MNRPGTVVVAIGGNSLIGPGQKGTIAEQFENARGTARSLGALAERGWRMALVHGNGPQVGFILRRSEAAPDVAPRLSLDMCDADSQGGIGYMLQQALGNELLDRHVERSVVALITQVEVDPSDPAFEHPTKPIGEVYTDAEADHHRAERRWPLVRDGREGWRRVVPSPRPQGIVELDVIRRLVDDGVITICAGGGGIPVAIHADGRRYGVEAVIDKDRVSSLLAVALDADVFIVSTAVECVSLDYGTERERPVHELTVAEAERYRAEGQFPDGSMGPKIEAAVDFVKASGRTSMITDFSHLLDAMQGGAGTRIHP